MKAVQKIKSLVSKKVVFIVSVLIVASVVFCFKLTREKSISSITEESFLLCDSMGTDSLVNLYNEEYYPLPGNMYVMTGKIWNSGDLPIKRGDMKPQMRISMDNVKRILDFKVTGQSDSLVSFFSLKKIDQNNIDVDWKNFSPGFWFTYRIIYAGDASPGFKLLGKF